MILLNFTYCLVRKRTWARSIGWSNVYAQRYKTATCNVRFWKPTAADRRYPYMVAGKWHQIPFTCNSCSEISRHTSDISPIGTRVLTRWKHLQPSPCVSVSCPFRCTSFSERKQRLASRLVHRLHQTESVTITIEQYTCCTLTRNHSVRNFLQCCCRDSGKLFGYSNGPACPFPIIITNNIIRPWLPL